MPRIEFTANLARHLDCPTGKYDGATVREVLERYFDTHPRVRRYILDDQGGLQRHVVVFIDDRLLHDRQTLSDPVGEAQTLFVFQALSGG